MSQNKQVVVCSEGIRLSCEVCLLQEELDRNITEGFLCGLYRVWCVCCQ